MINKHTSTPASWTPGFDYDTQNPVVTNGNRSAQNPAISPTFGQTIVITADRRQEATRRCAHNSLCMSVTAPLVELFFRLGFLAPLFSNPGEAGDRDMELQPSDQELPPQDQGIAAWSFLLAAAIVEGVTWSIPFSFGIIIEDYLQVPEIASQRNAAKLVPLVGQLASGIIYCSAVFVYPYMNRYRTHVRFLMWFGMTLCWTSLLIASYSRKVYEYVIFQGVMYGIGGGLIYPPCILYMSEWFFKRRGFANGVIFAGTAVGGLVMPFLLPSLVKAYGLFLTLRIIAIASLVILLPCLMLVRPRLPQGNIQNPSVLTLAVSSISLRDRTWWTLVVANIFQGFGFFVPFIYIPTFSTALHLDAALSSIAMALLNGSSTAGQVSVGLLSDSFRPWPIASILSIVSLLCTIVFWGAIGDVLGVMLFCVTYGFAAGGWSTLWTSFIRQIANQDASLSMSMYGFMFFTRGLGNVLSTPISTALTPVASDALVRVGAKKGFTLQDGRFAPLIGYIGGCFAAATLISLVGWYLEHRHHIKRDAQPAVSGAAQACGMDVDAK